MTIQEAREAMIDVIIESAEPECEVTMETNIKEEMGLSSMEIVVLIGDLESEFGVTIPISALSSIETVEDLFQLVLKLLS